ncbi:hypothetical protein J6K35_06900 [bacterium]|nr:hypothetical protein [bacterium]
MFYYISVFLNIRSKARNIARTTLPAASAADAIGQGISNAADGIAGLVDHILDSLG